MPCCLLAAAVIAVIKARWIAFRAWRLRCAGRHVEAALLLEDDIRILAAAAIPVEEYAGAAG
jgi:hypothetical protein